MYPHTDMLSQKTLFSAASHEKVFGCYCQTCMHTIPLQNRAQTGYMVSPSNWTEEVIIIIMISNSCMKFTLILQTLTFNSSDGCDYFCSHIPMKDTTILPSSMWQRLCTKNDWQNVILPLLSKSNPYCSFSMRNHWVKSQFSQKNSNYSFRCTGQCTFSDCPVKFTLKIQYFDHTSPPLSLSVTISFSSQLVKHHKQERRSRQFSGTARTNLKKSLSLTSETPASLYNKTFGSLTEQELAAGNRDKVGSSPYVFQKASSEANREQLPHFDLITSLMSLDIGQQQSFIRRVTAKPFSVSLFTEEGLRIYHRFSQELPLYLDATGSIVSLKGTHYETDTCLYYAFVVGHPKEGRPPVAVAELISTEHSVLALSHFLQDFRRHEGKLYGYANMVSPKCAVIDRSMVLLLTFLQVFNMESLSDYLHRCFRILTGCQSDIDDKKTMVYACLSHVMNSAKLDMKKLL